MPAKFTAKKNIKEEEGVTLLLALIIMSTVVAVAIGVSVLIINQVQFSSSLNESISAFYAAETGLENSLLTVKANRLEGSLATTVSGLQGQTGTLSNKAGWTISQAAAEDNYLLTSLKANQYVTLDLFDPDDFDAAGGVESIVVDWSDSCEGASWLEMSTSFWTNSGLWDQNPYKEIFGCNQDTGLCDSKILANFDAGNSYRISITSLYCEVSYLKVTAYDVDYDPANPQAATIVPIGNRVSLKSVGTMGTSKVAISSNLPWRLPPPGIFDFVLFSEETIKKK